MVQLEIPGINPVRPHNCISYTISQVSSDSAKYDLYVINKSLLS